MVGPDDHRDDDGEDLFEDLDRFFAPIKDTDWPEEEPPPPAEAEQPAEQPDAPPTPAASAEDEDILGGWGGPQIDIPDPEELVGDLFPEPEPEAEPVLLSEPEPGEEPAPEPELPSEPEPEPELPREPEPEPVGGPAAAAEDEGVDEWERFREEVQREAAGTDDATEIGEPLTIGDGEDEPAVAPPRYAGLPGADHEDDDAWFSELTEEPAEPQVVEVDAEGADRVDVEAAAEHFAAGIRETPADVERELLADLDETAVVPGTVRIDPLDTEMGGEPGPSWDEPGRIPEEEPSGGRSLPAAVISGGLLAVAAVALLAIGKAPFAVLAGAVILLGQVELYSVIRARGIHPASGLGLVIGLLMIVGAYLRGEPALLFMLVLGMGLVIPWYMASPPKARGGMLTNVAMTILGIVYVPFLASFALVLLRLPGPVGRNLLLTVVGLTVLYDICAYAIGSWWGDRPLAPTISPRKSWEGVIGATFALLIVALAVLPLFAPFADFAGPGSGLGAGPAVGLALIIAIAAPLGDLAESALKRDLGIKDMGTILPGHGGILDRVDSLLFALPAAWYFLRVVLL